ncbi:hypothetical protein [Ferrovibrio sp.]|uniref:hypothetical protein n=1 Tax=Ferrovibrio sp. TaxID=1917215 RepID=UPI0025BF2EEB|nr:hypothetical protein [Ferrovibrio sp.]MBX3453156.1 hypothetical protein [Ferrovibrio sp.]
MNFPKGAGSQFQPTKFEERGTAVAFTTPALSQARVRKDSRDQLELTVSSFSGVKGNYVIRWKDVAEIFSLSMHDRELHEVILKANSCLPPQVRHAILEVAKGGLAGPEAQKSAEEALAEEENEALLTRFFLFKGSLERMTGGQVNLKVADFVAPSGRERVKAAMTDVAHRMHVQTQVLYDRLEQWGSLIAPLGLNGMSKECRLRRIINQIAMLENTMTSWSAEDKSEASELAVPIARMAGYTADYAKEIMASALRPVEVPEKVLFNWEKASALIQVDLERLWWTVDGWEFVLLLWADAQERDRDSQRAAVTEIYRVLPIIPEKEVANRPKAKAMQENSRLQVRALEGWNSGMLDIEMMRRVETTKKRRI